MLSSCTKVACTSAKAFAMFTFARFGVRFLLRSAIIVLSVPATAFRVDFRRLPPEPEALASLVCDRRFSGLSGDASTIFFSSSAFALSLPVSLFLPTTGVSAGSGDVSGRCLSLSAGRRESILARRCPAYTPRSQSSTHRSRSSLASLHIAIWCESWDLSESTFSSVSRSILVFSALSAAHVVSSSARRACIASRSVMFSVMRLSMVSRVCTKCCRTAAHSADDTRFCWSRRILVWHCRPSPTLPPPALFLSFSGYMAPSPCSSQIRCAFKAA
mmetsp:Transcript_694/g.1698  ORF Transcript_694/g.1698 Transcript_694/m.1698 type:complete len:273 (-) Transcript_694:374-1192(-)